MTMIPRAESERRQVGAIRYTPRGFKVQATHKFPLSGRTMTAVGPTNKMAGAELRKKLKARGAVLPKGE